MEYTEISVAVPRARAEDAAALLRDLTGACAWIDTPFSQPDLESDAVPREGTAVVHVYVRDEPELERARQEIAHAGIPAELATRSVAEEDWAEAWKAFFDVERYGERIVVVPSWRSYEPTPGDVVLTLDPGMAFGTGQHETTRMCLEALERAVAPGVRVLDVGCGSGILSLAAAKLGAREVVALDVDEDCARITTANADLNGVDGVVHAARGSLGARWPFAEPPSGFDVVVANIIARVIVDLAVPLVAALAPSGVLIVSGVIGEREGETVAALEAAGARTRSVRAMGEWRCIEAVRA